MSRYEEQQKKIKEASKKAWRRIAIYIVVISIMTIVVGSTVFEFDMLYVARTIVYGVSLVLLGMMAGAYIQSQIQQYTLPPPERRQNPELGLVYEEEKE